MFPSSNLLTEKNPHAEWWRTSVIYQIYPRSFADGNGDGMGDLRGVAQKLHVLKELGVDAVWFSPFFKSPQKDAGYDVSDYCDIDPLFGTLDDFDRLVEEANSLGLKIIVDLVPNHSSDQHNLFQAAMSSEPGSPERDMYIFRDGKGVHGEIPPNNWESVFGGPAWSRTTQADGTPGQWYLHIFDSSQPDFNWENPKVADMFDDVLRFWLDRGVAGFRVDVAHGMVKRKGLPDVVKLDTTMSGGVAEEDLTIAELEERSPYWGQPGVHEINKRFRRVFDEYEDRAMCGEAWIMPLERMASWVGPGEYHQTFNFGYLGSKWEKEAQVQVITESLKAFGAVGAPTTWVLSNHDVIRHTSRFGLEGPPPQGDGLGPKSEQPDEALGLRRARAATAFMLGLPGGAYIYQGEELGLPEHTTLADEYRQDPTFKRTAGQRVGRDGCRVPLPWVAGHNESNGFNETGESWLPQPDSYRRYARDSQEGVAGSTLELYKQLLKVRKSSGMGSGAFRWAPEFDGDTSLAYINNDVLVVANFTGAPIALPAGELLVTTQHDLTVEGVLEHDQVAWLKI